MAPGAQIIGVLDGNPRRSGVSDAEVPGRRGPSILLTEITNAVTERLEQRPGIVRRAVIDHEQLVVMETLSKNTFDGFREKLGPIISGNHHRNRWLVWHAWLELLSV